MATLRNAVDKVIAGNTAGNTAGGFGTVVDAAIKEKEAGAAPADNGGKGGKNVEEEFGFGVGVENNVDAAAAEEKKKKVEAAKAAKIDIQKSWLSDHPLISCVDTKKDIKIGVFNVLAQMMSEPGKNSGNVTPEAERIYTDHILPVFENKEIKEVANIEEHIYDHVIEILNILYKQPPKITTNNTTKILFDYDDATGTRKATPSKNFKKKKFHDMLIDEIFKTGSMGGFEYHCDHGLYISIEKYITAKHEFLKTQIKEFFSSKNKHKVLICPEFDYHKLLLPLTEKEKLLLPLTEKEHDIFTLKDNSDIFAVKCGYYAFDQEPPEKSVKFNPESNFCRVVFFQGLTVENKEIKKLKYEKDGEFKEKWGLDIINFQEDFSVVAVHLDSQNPEDVIPQHKNNEAEIVKEILESSYKNDTEEHPYITKCKEESGKLICDKFIKFDEAIDLYKKKHSKITAFRKEGSLEKYLKGLLLSKKHTYIAGDFNYPNVYYKNGGKIDTKYLKIFENIIKFPNEILEEDPSATRKERGKTLFNAQMDKGGDKRNHGTDFIGKLINPENKSEYLPDWNEIDILPTLSDRKKSGSTEEDMFFPYFIKEEETFPGFGQALSGGSRKHKRSKHKSRPKKNRTLKRNKNKSSKRNIPKRKKNSKNLRRRRVNGKKSQRRK